MTTIRNLIFLKLLAAGILGFDGRAVAASLFVPNFSFESPDVPDGEVFGPDQPNYPYYDPSDERFPGTSGTYGFIPGTGNGMQVVLLRGNAGGQTTLYSPNSHTVFENSEFTLTVAVGNTLLFEPGEVRISLLVDGSEVATTFVNSFIPGTFADYSTSFTTRGLEDPRVGKALTISLTHFAGSGQAITEIALDNVRLEMVGVPEPTTIVLLGTAAICAFRRRPRGGCCHHR